MARVHVLQDSRHHGGNDFAGRKGRSHGSLKPLQRRAGVELPPVNAEKSTEAAKHEERAQKSADALRAMLTALATAGIGAAYAVRDSSKWWIVAAISFALALACVVISWFFVKDRELARRDAAAKGEPAPNFPRWKRSWTWDRAGAFVLAVGVVLLAFATHR